MNTIQLFPIVGEFAENKDLARDIRVKKIKPLLEKEIQVTLDFSGINSATQSFVHALISDLIREYDTNLFDVLLFKNCSSTVQEIINIVVDYMLERD